MADRVPTVGPWQTDPVLQRLVQTLKATMADPAAARQPRGGGYQAEARALNEYVAANRQRLGIPDNYTVDIRTNGQTLYDPNQNQLRDALFTGGAMAAGGYGLGTVLGGGGAAAGGAGDASFIGNAVQGVNDAALGGVMPGVETVAGAGSVMDRLKKALGSPEGIASLATMIPAMVANRGGGANASADTSELRRINAITEARMRRADPLHQVAVQLAFGRAPVSARNGVTLPNVPLPQ